MIISFYFFYNFTSILHAKKFIAKGGGRRVAGSQDGTGRRGGGGDSGSAGPGEKCKRGENDDNNSGQRKRNWDIAWAKPEKSRI